MRDVLIKNGLILDGTGREGFAGHVNVDGEKIVSVILAETPEGEDIAAKGADNRSQQDFLGFDKSRQWTCRAEGH